MLALNFPAYPFKIKNSENKQHIFDIIRKKYVLLTPEEWVRQHVIHYLISEKNYPASLMAVERQFSLHKMKKRFDILLFDVQAKPRLIVECKSPQVKITQDTFDQLARYNLKYDAELLMVTNGIDHYFCSLDHQNQQYTFLKSIPQYQQV